MNKKVIFSACIILMIFVSSCSTAPKSLLGKLAIGMPKAEVEERLGTSGEVHRSSSGSGDLNFQYGNHGYVWYDSNNLLKGFASFVDESEMGLMNISRASGYKIKETSRKKLFVHFEKFSELRSEEARFVYLENKNNILNLFTKEGFKVVERIQDSEVVLIIKLGISDPKTTQETISTPVYNLSYLAPKSMSTQFVGSNGSSLGSATSTIAGGFQTSYGGQNTQTITTTEYLRSLQFIAVDNTLKDGIDNILWTSIVSSQGSSDDIRMIFPYLLYASIPVMNKSLTVKGYNLAGYHTGVQEVVGREVPRIDRTPAGLLKAQELKASWGSCNVIKKALDPKTCD